MIECMEPLPLAGVKSEPGFVHQIKWDGFRGIAEIQSGAVRIYNKSGIESTQRYPELSILAGNVNAEHAILDGEIVALEDGKPSFYRMLRRSLSKPGGAEVYPVYYMVFDLLWFNHQDIRPFPLEERQRMLRDCFKDSTSAMQADSFEDGAALFELMRQNSMEGVVSKRLSSRYTAGKRHADWFKTKIVKKTLCAVTGVNYKNGMPSSLSVGIYREGILTHAGDVGSGIKQEDLALLEHEMKSGDMPRIACWVRFSEWTTHGTMRHPVFLGFSGSAPEDALGEEFSL